VAKFPPLGGLAGWRGVRLLAGYFTNNKGEMEKERYIGDR
jgi:hypothetical protein